MDESLPDFPLLAHIEALRKLLFGVLLTVALCFPFCWMAAPPVIKFLIRKSLPEQFQKLYYFSPMEAFLVQLKLALVLACIAAFPVFLWLLWRFISPGLYHRERGFVPVFVLAGTLLFSAGTALNLFAVLPIVMHFALGFSGPVLTPLLNYSSVVSLALWMSAAFGVLFQFPLAVIGAVQFGIADCVALRRMRPLAVTVIFIFAGVFTPPDVLSQLLVALPTWLLFEAGLFVASIFEKRKLAEEAEADEPHPPETPPPDTAEERFEAITPPLRMRRRPLRFHR